MQPKFDIRSEATRAYLEQIKQFLAENALNLPNKPPYKDLKRTLEEITKLDSNTDTRTLYTVFQVAMDKVARYEMKKRKRRSDTTLDSLFIALYENQNNIHNKIYEAVIKGTNNKNQLKENIKNKTTDPDTTFNLNHPDNKANAFFASMLGGFGYNPLKDNNVPYVAFNKGETLTDRTCLRIGAQTQGSGELNPTFERYLLANARKKDENGLASDNEFDYVYISLLKRRQEHQEVMQSGISKQLDKFVRDSEGKRANALEDINGLADLKAAAITLPADGDFFLGKYSMSKGHAISENESTNLNDLFLSVVDCIKNNKNDFYMSNEVKVKLFCDFIDKKKFDFDDSIVKELFTKSIEDVLGKDFGLNKDVTPEQRNAVLFHFVKYHLSNHILETLKPKVYNMSCKDAIDRGGIHTLWYHLNERYHQGRPMDKETFLKYLDSPAMVVKYRPLNANRNLIWNVLNERMANDPEFRKQHTWAMDWLQENRPSTHSKLNFDSDSEIENNEEPEFDNALSNAISLAMNVNTRKRELEFQALTDDVERVNTRAQQFNFADLGLMPGVMPKLEQAPAKHNPQAQNKENYSTNRRSSLTYQKANLGAHMTDFRRKRENIGSEHRAKSIKVR